MNQLVFISFALISFFNFSQENWEQKADSLIANAEAQIGVKYKYATSKPDVGFDCSGFTSYIYASVSVPNSRSSKAYVNLGKNVSLSDCRKGDCILFTGTNSNIKSVGHVGIVLENNENGLKFIHCSSSKKHFGVTVTDYYNSGYTKRFMEVRRLFE